MPPPYTDDDDDDGDASVSIGDFESAADRDGDGREHEETKRLLYVALTRARDRLYLAGTISGGKLVLQRGSIGRVLPPTLSEAMLAGEGATITWAGSSGRHTLRRLRFSLP